MQISNDKEVKLKEEIVRLKVKLVEAKNVEEGLKKRYKKKENECENLEVEVVCLRKQQNMEKSIVFLDSLLMEKSQENL